MRAGAGRPACGGAHAAAARHRALGRRHTADLPGRRDRHAQRPRLSAGPGQGRRQPLGPPAAARPGPRRPARRPHHPGRPHLPGPAAPDRHPRRDAGLRRRAADRLQHQERQRAGLHAAVRCGQRAGAGQFQRARPGGAGRGAAGPAGHGRRAGHGRAHEPARRPLAGALPDALAGGGLSARPRSPFAAAGPGAGRPQASSQPDLHIIRVLTRSAETQREHQPQRALRPAGSVAHDGQPGPQRLPRREPDHARAGRTAGPRTRLPAQPRRPPGGHGPRRRGGHRLLAGQ
ncbi:hypothetical protein RA210_U10243 [Rubrivivax sp. A210]|nr:hypothetical protein RA210_U10243 [Rubrivivax sp. A210]